MNNYASFLSKNVLLAMITLSPFFSAVAGQLNSTPVNVLVNAPGNPFQQPYFQMMVKGQNVPGTVMDFTNQTGKKGYSINFQIVMPFVSSYDGAAAEGNVVPTSALVSTDFVSLYATTTSPDNPTLMYGMVPWTTKGYFESKDTYIVFQRPAQVYLPSTMSSNPVAVTFPDYLDAFHANLQQYVDIDAAAAGTQISNYVNNASADYGYNCAWNDFTCLYNATSQEAAQTFYNPLIVNGTYNKSDLPASVSYPSTTPGSSAGMAVGAQWHVYYPSALVHSSMASYFTVNCSWVKGIISATENSSTQPGFPTFYNTYGASTVLYGSASYLSSTNDTVANQNKFLYGVETLSGSGYQPVGCGGNVNSGGISYSTVPFSFGLGLQFLPNSYDMLDYTSIALLGSDLRGPDTRGGMLATIPVIYRSFPLASNVVNSTGIITKLSVTSGDFAGNYSFASGNTYNTGSQVLSYWQLLASNLGPNAMSSALYEDSDNTSIIGNGVGISSDAFHFSATQAPTSTTGNDGPIFAGTLTAASPNSYYWYPSGITSLQGPIMTSVTTSYGTSTGSTPLSIPEASASQIIASNFTQGTYLQIPDATQMPTAEDPNGAWTGGLVSRLLEHPFHYYAGINAPTSEQLLGGKITRGYVFEPYLPLFFADPRPVDPIGWSYCPAEIFNNAKNKSPQTCYECVTSPMTNFSLALQGTRNMAVKQKGTSHSGTQSGGSVRRRIRRLK